MRVQMELEPRRELLEIIAHVIVRHSPEALTLESGDNSVGI